MQLKTYEHDDALCIVRMTNKRKHATNIVANTSKRELIL